MNIDSGGGGVGGYGDKSSNPQTTLSFLWFNQKS